MGRRGQGRFPRERIAIDGALLLVPLIGLVAVWPLLTQSLPSTDDGALHMLRLVEIDRCLRHGVLPLRWAPDFAHGYGYPFFNYYASLSSYIAELWHLAGLDFPQAIAGATVTAFFVSGWGAYLLGRDLAGPKSGLVAATAYMYAPYQFYDSAYRGNLAETWALALLPWVLWTGRRAALGRRWRDIVPCAVLFAALIYTHNVYALIASPILGLYLFLLWWLRGRSWRDAWRLGSMIAIGLALSAFFWLPAFLERGWTRFSTDLVDYRTFFLSAAELLAWPPQVDLSRLNAYPPRSLSWGMLVLIAAGGVIWMLTRGTAARHGKKTTPPVELRFFALLFLAASLMTVGLSDWVWRTVPLIDFALIPWRYLGIASLAGSIVAGVALSFLVDRSTLRSPALLATVVAIALMVATAIPWTYAAPFPQPRNMGVAEIINWEYNTKLIGTTAKNEWLPIWSPGLPPDPADPALLTEHDPIITRLDATSLPKGATVTAARYTLMRGEMTINSPDAFRARYKQFYFPGWQVQVDGQTVTPIATAPYGLLGFDVPPGNHHIVIRPTITPIRLVGNSISVFSALSVIVIAILDRRSRDVSALTITPLARSRREAPPDAQRRSKAHGEMLSLQSVTEGQTCSTGARPSRMWEAKHWICVAVSALLLLGVKEGLVDRTENVFRAHRFDGQHLPGAQTGTAINFGNTLTLHGYDLPTSPVVAGEPLRVDLYLSAQGAMDRSYTAYARLVDQEGHLWSLRDNGAPEGHRPPPPTTLWPSHMYGHWAYLSYTLPGTPPGQYWIEIAIFDRESWQSLSVLDDQGAFVGLTARIGPVRIVRPRTPPDFGMLDVGLPLQVQVGPDIRFLGSTLSARSARAGDPLEITLFWQAVGYAAADYHLRLELGVEPRVLSLGDNLPLGRHEYRTSEWVEGEVVRSPHRVRIPATAEAGTHAIRATVLNALGDPVAPPIRLAEISISPTERRMTVPPDIEHQVGSNLGQQVTLLGYDLPAATEDKARIARGMSFPITLYWQARREMEISYKVFVQLIGPGGVLSQIDAVPVAWTRPTTGWIEGEVVMDEYTLAVPSDAPQGTFTLIAGMYGEESFERLAVLDAAGVPVGDHIVLVEVLVE